MKWADLTATSGQFSWPPVGSFVTAYGHFFMAADRRLSPGRRASAEDVVADVFLTAWRRLEDVPTREGEALLWLYGVTRNCLLNARRTGQRQEALAVRLAADAELRDHEKPTTTEVELQIDLAAAWQMLTPVDQEVLALALFEDLTSRQAGRVLGVTPAGYRMRLARARRALRLSLDLHPHQLPAAAPAPVHTLQENL